MARNADETIAALLELGNQAGDKPAQMQRSTNRNPSAVIQQLQRKGERARAVDQVVTAFGSMAGELGRGFNSELAGLLGLPGEITESVMSLAGVNPQFAGADEFARIFDRTGVLETRREGDNPFMSGIGRTLAGAGFGAAGVLSRANQLGGAARQANQLRGFSASPGLAPAQAGTPTLGTAASGAFDDIAASAALAPGRFAAAEGGQAVGAGLGLGLAEAMGVENPLAQLAFESVGGMGPGFIKGYSNLIRDETLGLTQAGVRPRVAAFMGEAVGRDNVDSAIANIDEDTLVDSMTSAQKIGSGQVLKLERSIVRSSGRAGERFGALMQESDRQISNAIKDLQPGELTKEIVDNFFDGRIDNAVDAMDARLKQAISEAQEHIADLPPAVTSENASRIARQHIDDAYADARDLENKYWGSVNRTAPAVPKRAKTLAKSMRAKFDEVTMKKEDFPFDVLDRIEKLDDVENLGRLQELRSTILEDIRTARGGTTTPRRPFIRRLGELQEALLDDLGVTLQAQQRNLSAAQQTATGPTAIAARNAIQEAKKLEAALGYSRELNDRFTRGPVGKLMGYERAGELKVGEELTLEGIMRGGPVGKEVATRMIEAVGGTDKMKGMMSDYIRDQFVQSAVDLDTGKLSVGSYKKFMKRHGKLLSQFPELQSQLSNAAKAQAVVDTRMGQVQRSKAAIQKSKAALWVEQDDINKAFNTIMSTQTRVLDKDAKRYRRRRSAKDAMRNLRLSAERDPDGQALEGVRRSFSEYILNRVAMQGINPVSGRRFVNSRQLDVFFTEQMPVIKEILSEDQIKRLRRVVGDARQVQKSVESGIAGGSDTFQNLSVLQTTIARVLGARLGSAVSGKTPGGSIQSALIGSQLIKGYLNKLHGDAAQNLIEDAILDPKVMRALLIESKDIKPRKHVELLRGFMLEAGIPDPDPTLFAEEEQAQPLQ